MKNRNYYSKTAQCAVSDSQGKRGMLRIDALNDPDTEFSRTPPQKGQNKNDGMCRHESSGSFTSTTLSTNSTANSTLSIPCIGVHALQSPPRASTGSEIRSRFLTRLGFTKQEDPKSIRRSRDQVSPVILQGKNHTLQEKLKGDHGRNSSMASRKPSKTKTSSSDCAQPEPRTRSISFDKSVQVHLIPKRTDYSDRIRTHLWTDSDVQQQNVARNCVEFAAEGWNWQHVEEEMVVTATGEKIHPVHFYAQNNLNWRFCAIRAMQQKQQHHHQHHYFSS